MERRVEVVSAKVPASLRAMMEEFVRRDAHLNISDLIRDAVREKILREAPDLYKEYLTQGGEQGDER